MPALLRGIYAYHVNGNGWCDIGYQFFVDRFGRLYEGRFGGDYKNVVGAQAQGFNMQTFGISSLGNHDPGTTGAVAPTSTVLSAIGKLIGWKAWLNGWDPATSVSYTSAGSSRWPDGTVITKPRVSGHRDFNLTDCPGDLMFSKLPSIRSTAATSYKAGLASTTAEVAAASVVETYTRPSGTSFALSGRGYGHGRGMSQYGAYGAALSGLTRDEILAFYYPNTTRSTAIGNPTVRVQAHRAGYRRRRRSSRRRTSSSPTARRTGPLYVKNSDGTLRTRWRVVPGGTGLTLQWLQSGAWRSAASWTGVTKPLSFSDATLGKVRVVMPDGTQRDYRRTVRTRAAPAASLMTLSVVPMDYYLQSVVPSEMPPSWSPAALQVQAVAARTYAAYEIGHQAAGSAYDLCDSTACQVYKGLAGYTASGTPCRTSTPRPPRPSPPRRARRLLRRRPGVHPVRLARTAARPWRPRWPTRSPRPTRTTTCPRAARAAWTTSLSISTIEGAYPTTGTLKAPADRQARRHQRLGRAHLERDDHRLGGLQDRHRRLVPLHDGPAQHVVDRHLGPGDVARPPGPRTSTATTAGDLLAVDTAGHAAAAVRQRHRARSPPKSMGTGWGSRRPGRRRGLLGR